MNKMLRSNQITICNFTGVYESRSIASRAVLLDFRDMTGCSLYVSGESEQELALAVKEHAPEGIHFLDNGNYHYMTRIFASFIREPFELLVLDHHTDDQEPAIPGMRSCGSWVRDIREENPCLEGVTLIRSMEDYAAYRRRAATGLPVYVSVDKDVLSEEVLRTNWDQGDMKEEEFSRILSGLLEHDVIGLDICGDDEPLKDTGANEVFDAKVLSLCFHGQWRA